jgi:hypothetical protein
MIVYKNKYLPDMHAFLKNGYIHFHPFDNDKLLFESSSQKLKDEKEIPNCLNKILSNQAQLDALIYCLKHSV